MPDSDHGPATAFPAEESTSWRVILGGVIIVVLAGGWFVMSWRVMGSAVSDAVGEALGVALGLLVAISVVGAVIGARVRPASHRSQADK